MDKPSESKIKKLHPLVREEVTQIIKPVSYTQLTSLPRVGPFMNMALSGK